MSTGPDDLSQMQLSIYSWAALNLNALGNTNGQSLKLPHKEENVDLITVILFILE